MEKNEFGNWMLNLYFRVMVNSPWTKVSLGFNYYIFF
jgi:hypothetical protein